jgi:hypothetical protein
LRSKQKKFKFSKGEITERLLERQDMDVLESAASYIKNMFSTPYGSLVSRPGSKRIDKILDSRTFVDANVTSNIGGNTAYVTDEDNMFVSDGTAGVNELIRLDFSAAENLKISLERVYFDFARPRLSLRIERGVIVSVDVVEPGLGVNDPVLTIDDHFGRGFEAAVQTDAMGRIVSVQIINGGARYSESAKPNLRYKRPETALKLQALAGADWVDAAELTAGEQPQDVSVSVPEAVTAVRLYTDKPVAARLNLYSFRTWTAGDERVRLLPFVFSAAQKYLLVVRNEVISIYENDALLATVDAPGLLSAYFDKLKHTQAEDTMIFTHPDMPVKMLQRTLDAGGNIAWVFGDFVFTKIPYSLFGNEVKTKPGATLTPSETDGLIKLTASAGIFSADSVGQLVDGGGGRARITEYIDALNVFGYTVIPFYTKDAIAADKWEYITGYAQAWSETRGWPVTCMFYQQRLWFGGAKSKPSSVFASRINQYDNFENVGNYDNDAISETISSDQIDEIVNIYPNRGVQVFTAGGEWVIPEGSTTPGGISFIKNTSNGSLPEIKPVDIAGITMFVEKNGSSLLSFVYSDAQAAYTTDTVNMLTDIVRAPVAMAVDYNSARDTGNFLYVVKADGTMAAFCVIPGQNVVSATRYETEGKIIDCVNVYGDNYVLVNRDDVLYLERLDYGRTDCTIQTAVDDQGMINNLSDYNGRNAHVYTDSKDLGSYFVLGGMINAGAEASGLPVYLGIEYSYKMISTKIAIDGQTENIEKRIAKATIATRNTRKLNFCGQTLRRDNDRYDLYGVTSFRRDCRFWLEGVFDACEILSVLLNINYGSK